MTDTRNSLPKPGARHSAQGRPPRAALLLPLLPGLAVLTVAAVLFFTAGPSIAKAVLGILCFIAGMPFLGLGFLVAGQRLAPPTPPCLPGGRGGVCGCSHSAPADPEPLTGPRARASGSFMCGSGGELCPPLSDSLKAQRSIRKGDDMNDTRDDTSKRRDHTAGQESHAPSGSSRSTGKSWGQGAYRHGGSPCRPGRFQQGIKNRWRHDCTAIIIFTTQVFSGYCAGPVKKERE